MLKKQKDEEAAKTLAAAKALSEDLVNQWAQSLDKTEMTEMTLQRVIIQLVVRQHREVVVDLVEL